MLRQNSRGSERRQKERKAPLAPQAGGGVSSLTQSRFFPGDHAAAGPRGIPNPCSPQSGLRRHLGCAGGDGGRDTPSSCLFLGRSPLPCTKQSPLSPLRGCSQAPSCCWSPAGGVPTLHLGVPILRLGVPAGADAFRPCSAGQPGGDRQGQAGPGRAGQDALGSAAACRHPPASAGSLPRSPPPPRSPEPVGTRPLSQWGWSRVYCQGGKESASQRPAQRPAASGSTRSAPSSGASRSPLPEPARPLHGPTGAHTAPHGPPGVCSSPPSRV